MKKNNLVNIFIDDSIRNVIKKIKLEPKKISISIVDEIIKEHNINLPCTVNITISNSEYVKQINLETRKIDSTTDVLSFPNIDFQNFVGDVSIFDAETNNVFLGDILVNIDKVITQAKEYDHSEKREFAFLVCHSMLHLLGYDHMKKNEEKEMFAMQERILNNLGICR